MQAVVSADDFTRFNEAGHVLSPVPTNGIEFELHSLVREAFVSLRPGCCMFLVARLLPMFKGCLCTRRVNCVAFSQRKIPRS